MSDSTELVPYVIRRGDTLSKISSRFGTDWGILYDVTGPDNLKNSQRLRSGSPHLIYPGEMIYVPAGKRKVRIDTKNAPTAVTKVRVRKTKQRKASQKKQAAYQDIYHERRRPKAVDNLAIVAGWDANEKRLDVKELCKTLQPIIDFEAPKVKDRWYLFYLPNNSRDMLQFDSKGNFQHRFKVDRGITGLAGAYSIVERDAREMCRAIFDVNCGLAATVVGKPIIGFNEMIVGKEDKKRFIDDLITFSRDKKYYDFKRLPIYFLAPSSEGSFNDILIRGSRGFFDRYCGTEAYNEATHKRNVALAKAHRRLYLGRLNKYIEKVKKIPASAGENAIRKLGPPPKPYRFPMPSEEGDTETDEHDGRIRELRGILGDCSSYRAWQVIADKLHNMEAIRWPNMANQHQEGDIFFRMQLTLEDAIEEKLKHISDTKGFGGLYAYEAIKIELSMDVGVGGVKKWVTESKVVKQGGQLNVPNKFSMGAGREIEIQDGKEKVTFKANLLGRGVSISTDGTVGATVGFAKGTVDTKNYAGGYGVELPLPGLGSLYVGIHFQSVKEETLLLYITRAPGFFELRSCDDLVKTHWTDLTYPEIKKLKVLKWNQGLWDRKNQLKENEKPMTVSNPFDALTYDQKIAAMHLGFTKGYAANWQTFWRSKLKPVRYKGK